MRYFYIFSLILSLFLISGCGTTEESGGSSLPWSQPEPWEKQTLPMGEGE